MSLTFYAAVIAFGLSLLFAVAVCWRSDEFTTKQAAVRFGLALVVPLFLTPLVGATLAFVGSLVSPEIGGSETSVASLIERVIVELNSDFVLALTVMPYHAIAIGALALAVLLRHGTQRAHTIVNDDDRGG